MSQQDYYNDSSQWGQYQYITLEQVISDYMAGRDSDDYDSKNPRYMVYQKARNILSELYYDVMQEIKAIQLEVNSSLQLTLPEDYVDYVRISVRKNDGKLYPIAENKSLNISRNYLQDSDAEILFDSDGYILQSSKLTSSDYVSSSHYFFCYGYTPSPNFNTNIANLYAAGSYIIDKDSGVIRFSSEIESKDIVLEYVSDGLYVDTDPNATERTDDTAIRVHKFAEQALVDGIYYLLIKKRRNVPANEKARARKEYYNSRRIAKRRLNKANRNELIQAMKGVNVWNKNV